MRRHTFDETGPPKVQRTCDEMTWRVGSSVVARDVAKKQRLERLSGVMGANIDEFGRFFGPTPSGMGAA
jgi:hypothetical protein